MLVPHRVRQRASLFLALLSSGSTAWGLLLYRAATNASSNAAARMEPGQGMSTAAHMLLFITLALLMTVPSAYLLEQQFGFENKWTLGPVAVLIAGIGQDWPKLVRWAIEQARGFIERWVSRKGEQP